MHRGLLIAVPFFTGFSAFMFVSALTFQQGAHLSPFQSGLALLPMAVSFLLASLLTARMVARFGPTVLTMGALIQALGLTGLAFTLWQTWPTVDPVSMAPAMIVAGIGQAFVLSPLFGFILAGVPAERAGVGSGILTTTQQSALALGVATLGSMFLSLSAPDSIGFRDAFVAVLAAQVAIALVVAIASRTMPRPQRAKAPVIRVEPVTAGRLAAASEGSERAGAGRGLARLLLDQPHPPGGGIAADRVGRDQVDRLRPAAGVQVHLREPGQRLADVDHAAGAERAAVDLDHVGGAVDVLAVVVAGEDDQRLCPTWRPRRRAAPPRSGSRAPARSAAAASACRTRPPPSAPGLTAPGR